jgi:AraC-like DNA-binding protein
VGTEYCSGEASSDDGYAKRHMLFPDHGIPNGSVGLTVRSGKETAATGLTSRAKVRDNLGAGAPFWRGSCVLDWSRPGVCSMRATGTIVAGLAQEMLASLERRQPDGEPVAARVGIARAHLDTPGTLLPLAAFTSMLETAANDTGNSSIGLQLGKEFNLSALGPLSPLMRTAKTVGHALEQFTRFFNMLQTNTLSRLEVSGDSARLFYSISDPGVRYRVQDANFTLMVEFCILKAFLGASWSPAVVAFEHSAGADLSHYQRHFGCPLRFRGDGNALIFPSMLLETPLPDADEALHLRLEAELADSMQFRSARLDLIDSIEAWVAASFCRSGAIDIANAASDFGVSVRSLQRKLADRGTNYFDVRNDVRFNIAKCMLSESSVPITSIALHLGYSETSAFSRGFRQRAGKSPAQFRKLGGEIAGSG